MIITNPKKLSMPQQVQKNKEDIEDIRKIIDGLDVEDNVVVVNNISQILTAEELEAIKQPVAFIVYNNHLYFKNKTTSTTAYFDVVFSIALSTVITFESSEIQVELSNGALGIVNSTVNTYSQTQIDNKFATITYVDNNFAKLTGANFIGEITAPSIVQTMGAGYSYLNNPATDINAIYVGCVRNGNKLTAVWFMALTATDTTYSGAKLGDLNLPSEVLNKLYPFTLSGNDTLLDVKILPLFYEYNQKVDANLILQKYTGSIVPRIYVSGLTVGKTYLMRYEATFLLSDNLAQ